MESSIWNYEDHKTNEIETSDNTVSCKQIYTRFRDQSRVDWGTDEFFFYANRNLIENLASLKVCPICFELCGDVLLEDDQSVWQKCHCDKSEQEKWKLSEKALGFQFTMDFNCILEICNCCGLEVIPSGSKWSDFFCTACGDLIINLNKKAGTCIIPIGRHSMMNGFGISNTEINNDFAIPNFSNGLFNMIEGIKFIYEHKKYITAQRIEDYKLPKYLSVMDLILATFRSDNPEMIINKKRSAFIQMACKRTGWSTDELIEFYNRKVSSK